MILLRDKKVCILVLFLLFMSNSMIAQSGGFKVKENGHKVSWPNTVLMDLQNGNFLRVTLAGNNCLIQKFGTGNLNEKKVTEFTDIPDYSKIQKLIRVDERIYVFYETYQKRKKLFDLNYREIDLETLQLGTQVNVLSLPAKSLHKIPLASCNTYFNFRLHGSIHFDVTSSKNEKNVLIQYQKRDANKVINRMFYVLDVELQKSWEVNFDLNEESENISIENYFIANSGKVHILSEKLDPFDNPLNSAALRDKYKKTVAVHILSSSGLDFKKSITANKMGLDKMIITEVLDGEFVIAGYKRGSGIGVAYYSEEGVLGAYKFSSFYDEEVSESWTVEDAVVEDNEINGNKGFLLLYLRVMADEIGNIFVICEDLDYQEKVRVSSVGKAFVGNFIQTHEGSFLCLKDIFIAKFSDDLEHQWSTRLTKNQYINKGSMLNMSYKVDFIESSLLFLFLDDKNNESLDEGVEPYFHAASTKGAFATYEVNIEDGTFSKKYLNASNDQFKVDSDELDLNNVHFINEDSYIFEIVKWKVSYLIKLNYD